MQHAIFNLSIHHWGVFLLAAVPALINAGIFIYTLFFLPQRKTNRAFSIFILLLGIFQIADGLIRMSNTQEAALLWNTVKEVPLVFIPSFGLLFTLYFFGGHTKTSGALLFAILFLPAILFALMITAGMAEYTIVKSEQWNWIVNPEPNAVTLVIYGWLLIMALPVFILLWVYYFKERSHKNKKIQALLLAVGFSFPFIAGIIGEAFFPLILEINSIPLSTPSLTIFSVFAIIAIKRYSMLDYSPRHQWQSIIKTMNEGVLIVDNSDRIMYANNAFFTLTGFEWNEMKGKTSHELFIDDIRYKKQITKAIEDRKNNKSSQYEMQIKTKTGEKRWIIASASLYLDRQGKALGSIGIYTDISKRKQAEDEKNLFQSLVNHSNDSIEVIDTGTGRFLDGNEKAWGKLGYTREEFLTLHVSDIDPLVSQSVFARTQEELRKSGFMIWESFHRRKDGSTFPVEVNISIIRLDREYMVAIARDISERKNSLEKLVEAESQIRNFAAHLNHVMEEERAYIAREIHDEIGQQLVGIKMNISFFKKLGCANAACEEKVNDMMKTIDITMQSLRQIATELRPGILDTLGLIPSLKWLGEEFSKKTKIKCIFSVNNTLEKFEKNISTCFFRICQEALTNISKHARASEVVITIKHSPATPQRGDSGVPANSSPSGELEGTLVMTISDNGKGIAGEKLANPFSMGLLGMRERANIINACLDISSQKDKGTTIQLSHNLQGLPAGKNVSMN